MPEVPNLPPEPEQIPQEIENNPAQPPAAPAAPIDYEKKFAESTRENQILSARLAAEEQKRQELTKEPTDSELRTAFPSWDLMSDTEKDLARRTIGAERAAKNATQFAEEQKQERSWNTSIELAASSNPALQGKEQAFSQFASKPQYRGVSMDILVDAFLQRSAPAPAPATTPRPGLEPGNGGPRTPEKPQTLSAEQLKLLRTSDPKEYEKYLKTHDIDIED
jgi:hypothetical protein